MTFVEEKVRFLTARTDRFGESRPRVTYELAGLWTPGRPGAPAVLCVHGMLSSKESDKQRLLAEALHTRGLATLRFDMSGRGESAGSSRRIVYSQEVADLAAAADFAKTRGHSRLALFGSSMGGAVSVLFAARSSAVFAVVTLAAVSRPGHWAKKEGADVLRAAEDRGFFVYDGAEIDFEYFDDAASVDVLAAASKMTAPLLVLHGEKDAVVPVEDGHLLARAALGSRKELYPEGDHRFSREEDLRDALAKTLAFFDRVLGL